MLYYDRMTFLKELMLIREANQDNVIFVTTGISYTKILSFNQISAMDAMI